MIYNVETYYRNVYPDLDSDGLRARLSKDRVTMAIMLASGERAKAGVSFRDFAALARLAEDFYCLSVYVDFYGRPVSYVIAGDCQASPHAERPSVRFGAASKHIYLADFVVREGSLDDTISLWLRERQEDLLTVRRSSRPRQYRSYRLSRIREMNWRTAVISNRFSNRKGIGLAEYEEQAKMIVANYQEVETALCAIALRWKRPIDITIAVPLLYDLAALQQLFVVSDEGACSAIIAVALVNACTFCKHSRVDILDLGLQDFVDGEDIVLMNLFGEADSLGYLQMSILQQLCKDGEKRAFVSRHASEKERRESLRLAGWQEVGMLCGREDFVLVELGR